MAPVSGIKLCPGVLIRAALNTFMGTKTKCDKCGEDLVSGFEFECADCGCTFCGKFTCVGSKCTCGARCCVDCNFNAACGKCGAVA